MDSVDHQIAVATGSIVILIDTRTGITRRLAHVAAGSSIVVLTLLLAFFGRVAPRARFLFLFLGLLLLAAVAAQVWLGTLLMWDTNSGHINAFN